MRTFLRAALVGVLLLAAGPARAQGTPEMSGMARFGPDALLVISDAKGSSPAPRASVLRLTGGKPLVSPVIVDDWKGDPPSDLEACCPVPGTSHDFFLAESGWWKDQAGRIFRLRLSHDPARGWVGTVVSSFHPFPSPPGGSTPDPEQVEGMAAVLSPSGRIGLLLGRRGSGEQPGRLVWGTLEGETFSPAGEAPLDLREFVPGGRGCGDLSLVEEKGTWKVLSVAASDPGDQGPFRSVVCEVGTLGAGGMRFVPSSPKLLWQLDGLKVEALAPTPAGFGGSPFCVGTDDENYGGIWRPLPALR